MSPSDLIAAASAAGLALRVESGALRVRGPQATITQWAPRLKEHKPELIAILKDHAALADKREQPTPTHPEARPCGTENTPPGYISRGSDSRGFTPAEEAAPPGLTIAQRAAVAAELATMTKAQGAAKGNIAQGKTHVSNDTCVSDQLSIEQAEETAPPTCESWEERAAILEHDAGLTRPEAEDQATCRRWLIHHPDGWQDHTFTPSASLAELRSWYPNALAILPADDTPEAEEPGHLPEETDPCATFYRLLFAGMAGPRCLVTLNPEETHRAVLAGLLRPEDARGAVLLATRDPAGTCALLAIPQAQWDPFATLAMLDPGPGTLH